MKIVQIVTQMEAGGAQKVASLLTEGLRQRGHDAQLWFLYKKRPAFMENAYTYCFCARRPSYLQWAGLAGSVGARLRAERPEVMIAHTHSANAFAAPIAALAGVPVRLVVHHNPVETYTTAARVADDVAFGLGSYSMMVAVSGGVRESFSQHSELYKSRLHRIYNGIPATDPAAIEDVRSLYKVPHDHSLLVNVGRLAKQKNQGVLLKMLKNVPSATLLLVGEGETGIELRIAADSLGIADRVRFTGELTSPHVAAILEQSDLFLLPSLYESFCMAAVEAMYHGLPVVASDLPCLREVLGDEQLFFPVDDSNRLCEIVHRLLVSPSEREAMSSAGRTRAINFNVERMVGEYESLMQEALLYASKRHSTANDFGRLDALRRVPRIHDQL